MPRRSKTRGGQSNANRQASSAVKRFAKREHGFIRNHTRFDPPQYKTTVAFQFKTRLTITGTAAYTDIATNWLPNGVYSYKTVLIQAWNTTGNSIKLKYLEAIDIDGPVYVPVDEIETQDFGGKNHYPAVSICPPQDDWLNKFSDDVPLIGVAGAGDLIIDVTVLARFLLPIFDLDAAAGKQRIVFPEKCPPKASSISTSELPLP